MLQYSSLLFAPVAVVAYYVQHHFNHHVFVALLGSSVLWHSSAKTSRALKYTDMALAHAAFAGSLCDYARLWRRRYVWPIVFQALVAALYALEGQWPARADQLHVALHVVTAAGTITNMLL